MSTAITPLLDAYAAWQAGHADALAEADFKAAEREIRRMRDHWRAVRLRGGYADLYGATPPVSTAVARHAPVIAQLQKLGVPAFEESTGGGCYHVSFALPCGGYILADAPDGRWEVGLYRKTDDPDWRWGEGEMHDSGLAEDADPALVAAWLLDVLR